MTDAGRQHVISRLSQCPDLASLRKVWERLGFEYQRDPKILEFKEKLKSGLTDGRAGHE